MTLIKLRVRVLNDSKVVDDVENCIVTNYDLNWIGNRIEHWIRKLAEEHQSIGFPDEVGEYFIRWELYSNGDTGKPERVYIVRCRSEMLMLRLLTVWFVKTVI